MSNGDGSGEMNTDEYYDGLVDFIVNKWKTTGTITNEEETRECIDAMLFLMTNYNLKCLINTLFDIYDIVEEYDLLIEKGE